MLGWMLRRGEDAPENANDGDTTQIDQPDTPAPVFAARAFKSALFGTPARSSNSSKRSASGETNSRTYEAQTPQAQRPQGILLTPGTGTTRRKRVSFGHDVKKTNDPSAPQETEPRERVRVNDALDKASKSAKETAERNMEDSSADEWEEDEDEDFCTHDITVDLNEPHSQSGKYWKDEFEKYHRDAKAEMEKLLKYKQLAKSYAKQKDAEANELAMKLKEEQQKVILMEKQIVESRFSSQRNERPDEISPELASTLKKQTALAEQYRNRVQELEDQLEEFLKEREDDGDTKNRKRRTATSPRTQKTILETQRELRRARNQVRELGELRDEVSELKSQLRAAEKRANRAESQAKSTTSENNPPRESSRAQDLRVQLRKAQEEIKQKDEELRQLKQEFDAYRQEVQAHEEDTKGVLERAHNKIAELKKEVRSLKSGDQEPASRPKSWHVSADTGPSFEGRLGRRDKERDDISQRAGSLARRSFDQEDLDGDTAGLRNVDKNIPSLRQKFHEDALPSHTQSEAPSSKPASAFTDKPNLGRPKWQPFVPRSPRNRAYLGEELTKRIENGGATPHGPNFKNIEAPDLPALAKSIARSKQSATEETGEADVDLLQDRFARLGGPDQNNNASIATNSKSILPPARRAAAIARIEQRMAEKKRGTKRKGYDKENVRP